MLDDIAKIDELVKYSYTYGSSVALTWERIKNNAKEPAQQTTNNARDETVRCSADLCASNSSGKCDQSECCFVPRTASPIAQTLESINWPSEFIVQRATGGVKMIWGKRNECEVSVESRCRWRFILRHGSVYLAALWLRVRLVWRSDNEGETVVSW